MFWLDNDIYNLFNMMHRILQLNCLAIEKNIVINNAELF